MIETHLLKVSRLEGLTDGVFAIAMTILVLDLRLPPHIENAQLMSTLINVIFFKLLIYIGSFIILGTLWVAMNFQLGLLERLNRLYLWTHIYYLMTICVIPFSASLLASFPKNPASISFYALNLLCAGFGQFLIFQCSGYFNLNKKNSTPAIRKAILKRLLLAPLFYISSLILAHWSVSGAFILLILPTLIYIKPGKVDQFEHINTP
jgi:uncharacterized membrane protein